MPPLDGKCPECGDALKPRARKCPCGWTSVPMVTGMPLEYRCEWVGNSGQRCRFPATSSHGTLGHGPWYCSGHFDSGGIEGQRIVEDSQQIHITDYSPQALVMTSRSAFLDRAPAGGTARASSVDDAAARIGAGQTDRRAWAKRILEREARGERMPMVSIAHAREALKTAPILREPGED